MVGSRVYEMGWPIGLGLNELGPRAFLVFSAILGEGLLFFALYK